MRRQTIGGMSGGNDISDALRDFESERGKRARADRRRRKVDRALGWLREAPGWLRGAAIGVGVLLALLMVDGLRREAGELRARIAETSGTVNVVRGGAGAPTLATADQQLQPGDVILTGPGSTATIAFPDGSGVLVEEQTEFVVRLLDYTRDGARDRSFMVRAGSVVASVSRFFGVGSQATVCTPTAVAAVRGTGFRVVYVPAQRESYIQVVDGAVHVRTAAAVLPQAAAPGEMVGARGYALELPRTLPAQRRDTVSGQWSQLVQGLERPPGWLQRVEYAINRFCDPVLQVLGLAPGSWSYATNNAARRSACMEGLRRLGLHIAELGAETPQFLNPVTLEELQQDPREVAKIIDVFAGGMLESYQKTGTDTFRARARARNRGRTLFEVDETGGVREVSEGGSVQQLR